MQRDQPLLRRLRPGDATRNGGGAGARPGSIRTHRLRSVVDQERIDGHEGLSLHVSPHCALSPRDPFLGVVMTVTECADVAAIGAGPAGVFAALQAARLGARTVLLARDAVGGMAAADGPVPVRALAQAARLRREARHLDRYGIAVGETALHYGRLLTPVRDVVADMAEHSLLRTELQDAGVVVREHVGTAGFVDAHTLATENDTRLHADKVIVCAGGTNRTHVFAAGDITGCLMLVPHGVRTATWPPPTRCRTEVPPSAHQPPRSAASPSPSTPRSARPRPRHAATTTWWWPRCRSR